MCMQRLSINEMTTYRWSFEKDVAKYRQAGISAIGVWRQKLADYGEREGIALLRQHELEVSNLLWAGGFTGSDGRTYAESLADAHDSIRLAHALGAECLVIYSGGRNGHTQNHSRRLFASALKDLLALSTEYDITLAVEPMNAGCSGEWTFLNTLAETLSLLDMVGSPNVKLVFDTYHFGFDPLIVEQIRQLAGRIAIVHLGDAHDLPQPDQNRVPLGSGRLPLKEIVAAIEHTGYRGYYDVELLGEEIETSCYEELLRSTKQSFQQLFSAAK